MPPEYVSSTACEARGSSSFDCFAYLGRNHSISAVLDTEVAAMANDPRESAKIVETSGNFRDYLIPLDHPRLHPSDRDARTHAKGVLGNEDIFLVPVAKGWLANYEKPYKGFTTNGDVVPSLWHYEPSAGGPSAKMVEAANAIISVASEAEAKAFRYPVDAKEWRSWSNPEVLIFRRRASLRRADSRSGHHCRQRTPSR